MPTKISYQTWSGGSGLGDKAILIGYCKESPKEVLKEVYKTHNIYGYKSLYRPVDYSYPNNVEGLIIRESEYYDLEIPGLKVIVTGSIKDLDLNRAITKNDRNKEVYEYAINSAKEWHLKFYNKGNREKDDRYYSLVEQLKEVEEVILSD